MARATIPRSLKVGDLAPDFTLEGLDGHPVSLKAYRGRKLLLYTWASW